MVRLYQAGWAMPTKGAGGRSPGGKLRTSFPRRGRRKIWRQTNPKYVPVFAILKAGRVELGAKYCSETVRAKLAGVGDWEPIALAEVVCDR